MGASPIRDAALLLNAGKSQIANSTLGGKKCFRAKSVFFQRLTNSRGVQRRDPRLRAERGQ